MVSVVFIAKAGHSIFVFLIIAARRADRVRYYGTAFETAVTVLLIAAVASA